VVIIVYGAIPFVSIPTLGEFVWASGFAQSFLNAGWPSVRAINFGIPAHMPIPFGLAGAFLESTVMYLFHVKAWDAYAIGAVIWLALALVGCICLARLIGACDIKAAYYSLVYLTLPVVWNHAGYTMVSFGFALLPLYVYSAFRLIYEFYRKDRALAGRWMDCLFFVSVIMLAVFMDGYTYVMSLTGTIVIYAIALLRGDAPRRWLVVVTGPVIVFAAAISYVVYTKYLGVSSFVTAPIDFFRGFGVDIVMMLIPSREVSWLADHLGLSASRSVREFFGDRSVWTTTFCAPLLACGAVGFYLGRACRFALPFLAISIIGFYFSLGPSLKINSLRPPNYGRLTVAGPAWVSDMPRESALMSTGSAILDEHVPGFMSMRATYRWCGLLFTGLFGLSVLLFNELGKAKRRSITVMSSLLPGIIIATNLPHMQRRWEYHSTLRGEMRRMDSDLEPLNKYVGRGRRTVFYPAGNDFLVNYLAAKGGYYAYNVGGDKNLELASKSWPASIQQLFVAPLDCLEPQIIRVLASEAVDTVVIPYFDKCWDSTGWPPDEVSRRRLSRWGIEIPSVADTRAKYAPTIARLSADPNLTVKAEALYAVIALKSAADLKALRNIDVGSENDFRSCSEGLVYLQTGWSVAESWGTWSEGDTATVVMHVRGAYREKIVLTIGAFGFVNDLRPIQDVELYINKQFFKHLRFDSATVVSSTVDIVMDFLKASGGWLNLEFRIHDPKSPVDLKINDDPRKIGMGLVFLRLDLPR
jgi:hypothetical protein